MFVWKDALVIVRPETLIRRYRKGFRLFWRYKSKTLARPRFPVELRELIREMAIYKPDTATVASTVGKSVIAELWPIVEQTTVVISAEYSHRSI